jgi:hypothetical protein
MDSTGEKTDGKPVRAAELKSILRAIGDTKSKRVTFLCRIQCHCRPSEEVEIAAPLGALQSWPMFRRAALSQGWVLAYRIGNDWNRVVFAAVQAGEVRA